MLQSVMQQSTFVPNLVNASTTVKKKKGTASVSKFDPDPANPTLGQCDCPTRAAKRHATKNLYAKIHDCNGNGFISQSTFAPNSANATSISSEKHGNYAILTPDPVTLTPNQGHCPTCAAKHHVTKHPCVKLGESNPSSFPGLWQCYCPNLDL